MVAHAFVYFVVVFSPSEHETNLPVTLLNLPAVAETEQINMDSTVKARKTRVTVPPAAAPDGGYAWFVLLSCFLVFGLTFGAIKAFGVFYVEIQLYFKTTAMRTSWITSIAVATIHVVGDYHYPSPLKHCTSFMYSIFLL